MANLNTFTNAVLNQIKRQSVSLEKSANKRLIDVYCFEIDIDDYLVKNDDGTIYEEETTYTKQNPGGQEYQAKVVKRFFKGYPYINGTMTACNEKGEVLLKNNKPVEQVKIKGSRRDEELYGEYSFLVQNDKDKADLYIEKFYDKDESGKLVVKHHVYIEVYESTYVDKRDNKTKTALNYQTKVQFISDSKSTNVTNRLGKILAETEKFKSNFGLFKSNYAQNDKDGKIKMITEKDLI